MNLRLRVRAGEDDSLGSHAHDFLFGNYVGSGDAYQDVGVLKGLGKGGSAGVIDELRLPSCQIIPLGGDYAVAVADVQVLLLGSALSKQIHAGDAGCTGADADDLAILKLLALQLAGIEHSGSGDDRSAVLVIMEYRDLADFLELRLDLKALRSLDVFQVDSAEAVSDVCDSADKVIDALMLYFNIDGINIGKTLE